MSLALPSGRKVKMKTLGNWKGTYRGGILEVWEQGGCIRTGENCRIGGAE